MTHFLFHLHECGTETLDEHGRDFPDLAAAVRAAKVDALSIMAHEVRDGHLCLRCHIEVVESASGGRTLLNFRDLLQITE